MRAIDQTYKASVFEIKGTVHLQGDERGLTCRYDGATKLGRRLAWDKDAAQPVLANYIRQELGLPRGEAGATVITFQALP